MRVSLRWLSEYIDLPTESPDELSAAFASLGHEVEGIINLEADWDGVYVARVDGIRPHPNAERVRLCTVTTGKSSQEVVCGAWNFETGAKVAFGPVGARLAGGLTLQSRTIRGVASNGMILSERELGLGEDHSGILLLDHDAPLGVPLGEIMALPDVVFDLNITPNRGDVMSMLGVARELSAYFQVPHRQPPTAPPTVRGTSTLKVRIEDPSGCFRFVGRELIGVRVASSPLWMRQRLKAAGMRPISNVVDVTNYVMLELGQPLHAFDLDRVRGQTIVVRRAFEGERLVTLDGVDRRLTTEDLVVADGEVASGLAGTMGGEESEVSSSTTRILIEAAAWDPPTVGFMSRRHSLRSEASARFERGVDPNLPPQAAARAARLMLELGGGEALEGWIDAIAVEKPMWQITLTMSDVARILGDGFDSEMVAGLLRRLHLGVEGSDPLEVTVPTFRGDLTRPIDLVEEVARLWGYDNFSETVPTGGSGGWSAAQTRRRHLRSALSGAGLSEALTLSFLGKGDLEVMAYPLDHEGRLTIRVKNPLNDEMESLRTSLIPGLLRSLAYNHSHGLTDVGLYEIGRVFFARPWPEDRRVPDQPEKLGFAVGGRFGPVVFDSPTPFADSYTATALWRLIAEKLDLGGYELTPVAVPGFHPGRCAGVSIDGRPIGHVGEIHPATVAAYGLFGRVAAGELDLGLMLDPVPRRQLSEPSLYPPVDFDLAFEVSEETPASKVLAATAAAGSDLVESAHVFDEFKGGSLHDGRKSLAIRYRLRASDRTLTNQDAAAVRSAMIVAAASIGAVLRGS